MKTKFMLKVITGFILCLSICIWSSGCERKEKKKAEVKQVRSADDEEGITCANCNNEKVTSSQYCPVHK